MRIITMMLLLSLFLVACSNENSIEVKKDKSDNTTVEQTKEETKITKEFIKENAKFGASYDEVREIFGKEQYSGIMDKTMVFVYDSTTYKPFTYNQGGDAVAFDAIKSGKLDYQVYINFVEEKAVFYQYYFKGEDGEVWGYTVSSDGDNLSRNSGN
ncbi:hypothetical protein [Bacillus massiliigorillae]|uniref:hypothetical protein n=1 Tax=Bacillus massiliigorillae TaxID=1243664 RepID=UPI00039B982D|nr:hypothetical protein [Bacillus massiliigorillae]